MKALLKFLFFVFTDVLAVVVGGFVFATIWSWFVVPVFGLPNLSVVQAVGLLCVFGFPLLGVKFDILCQDAREKHKDVDDTTFGVVKNLVMALVCCPMALLTAYVVSLFL